MERERGRERERERERMKEKKKMKMMMKSWRRHSDKEGLEILNQMISMFKSLKVPRHFLPSMHPC